MRVWRNESRITISFRQICSTGHCWKFPGTKQWKVWNEGAASAWQAINGLVTLLDNMYLWCPSESVKRKNHKYFIKLIKIVMTDQHKNPDEKNNFDANRKVKNSELLALSRYLSCCFRDHKYFTACLPVNQASSHACLWRNITLLVQTIF